MQYTNTVGTAPVLKDHESGQLSVWFEQVGPQLRYQMKEFVPDGLTGDEKLWALYSSARARKWTRDQLSSYLLTNPGKVTSFSMFRSEPTSRDLSGQDLDKVADVFQKRCKKFRISRRVMLDCCQMLSRSKSTDIQIGERS